MSSELTRRAALKAFAGVGAAAFASGCSRPHEEILAGETLPYVNMPEGMTPGLAERYATVLTLAGEPRGVIVTAFEGRPIRIDGNPRHQASLGAADLFAQAEILSLYDPDRSQTARLRGEIVENQALRALLASLAAKHAADMGDGLRLLTGRVASPTLLAQIGGLLTRYPKMRWHVFEPAATLERKAAEIVYDRPLDLRPRLDDADILAVFDADPLGPGPHQMRLARAYSERRAKDGARLYAVEGGYTLTGAAADNRFAAAPQSCAAMLLALAARFGAQTPSALPDEQSRFVDALAKDLQAHRRRAIVLAGESLPPQVAAFALWINDQLDAPQELYEVDDTEKKAGSLSELADDLRQSRVATLVTMDCNPAQDAPGDLEFEALMRRAEMRLHLGLYFDETAAASIWHAPRLHALEAWTDAAAPGSASLAQPLIRPLSGGWSAHELVAALAGEPPQSDYDRIRETWRARWTGEDFDAKWRQALLDGVIAGAAAAPTTAAASIPPSPQLSPKAGPALRFRADPAVFDGRFANNAWLQECPRPFTKDVWGASLAFAPADARALGLADGDEATLRVGDRSVRGPVRIVSAQAPGVIEATLGYGRRRAGAIGDGVGFNVAPLRVSTSPFLSEGVAVAATGRHGLGPPSTAPFRALGGAGEILAPELAEGAVLPRPEARPSFNQPPPPPKGDPYAWAMVIDTDACFGCNACVVACQAENNVPVVGPEQVSMGRDMHWLRIDAHSHGPEDAPRTVFQPVPCMQCEAAPCEPVCPVEASVHDHEGLNVQVYNRCVGTRFCEANCPYKVRRFNFLGYADGQEYRNLGDPLIKAANNPDVSVRARGVMEKCTYCVQRISRARRTAEKEMRYVREGEVVTACQSVCPTRAIHFGNLADPHSDVARLKAKADHYALLDELHTRPRTTYLARRRNANPAVSATPT